MRSKEENGLSDSAGTLISPSVALRAKQMQVLDLERNIMQVRSCGSCPANVSRWSSWYSASLTRQNMGTMAFLIFVYTCSIF